MKLQSVLTICLVVLSRTHGASIDSSKFAFGAVSLQGFPVPIEFYRALWGGAPRCEPAVLMLPEDAFGCSTQTTLNGKVALVKRGECPFLVKANAAAASGAIGLLVVNSEPGLIRMPSGGQGPQVELQSSTLFLAMIKNSTANQFYNRIPPEGVEFKAFSYRESCVSATNPSHRKLGRGFPPPFTSAVHIAIASKWKAEGTLATFGSMVGLPSSPLMYRHVDKQLCDGGLEEDEAMRGR
jgi:hypothetical protein